MRRRSPGPPVLWAFLALLAGVLASGLLGPVLALASGAVIALATRGILALVHLRPPRPAAALWALVAIGAVRAGLDASPAPPGAGMALPPDALRAEVRVTRVVQRQRLATVADAELLRLDDPAGAADVPPDRRVRLRYRGFLDLPEGRVVAVRARWMPPARPSDALTPAWPRAAPAPTLVLVSPSDAVILAGPGLPVGSIVDRVRASLAERLRLHLPGDAADFALSVLLGEGNGIDAGTRADLAALGTAHVLSVSGLHVAAAAFLVGLVVVGLLGPVLLRLHPAVNLVAWHMGASILAAIGVSVLAGSPPPALRSAAMFAVAAAGALAGRPQRIEAAVAVAGFGSLLAWPSDAFSVSFLLSYAAILGLALLAPPLVDVLVPARWRDVPGPDLRLPARAARAVIVAIASSLAATLATTPITLLAFSQAGPAGPLANLFAIPVTTLVVMPAALGLLLVAAVAPVALPWAAPPVALLLDAFLWTQHVQARWLPAGVATSSVALAAVLVPSVALLARLLWPRPAPVAAAALGALAVALSLPRPPAPPGGSLAITFLDVGKGDAALVRCPTGRRFLVDAAEARAADGPSGLVAKLRAAGVDSLDGLVLTHADEDHVGGTPFVTRSVAVAEVVASCPAVDAEPLRSVLAESRARGIPVRCAVAGVDLLPGCADPAPALWPPPLVPARGNGASLVFRAGWGGRSVLLTGDLEAAGEEALVDAGSDLHADVLKAGHHGSPGASSPAFLAAVRPSTVVVSGFRTRRQRDLSPETARRVAEVHAALLDTPRAGDVTVVLGEDGTLSIGGMRTPGPRPPAQRPEAAR